MNVKRDVPKVSLSAMYNISEERRLPIGDVCSVGEAIHEEQMAKKDLETSFYLRIHRFSNPGSEVHIITDRNYWKVLIATSWSSHFPKRLNFEPECRLSLRS